MRSQPEEHRRGNTLGVVDGGVETDSVSGAILYDFRKLKTASVGFHSREQVRFVQSNKAKSESLKKHFHRLIFARLLGRRSRWCQTDFKNSPRRFRSLHVSTYSLTYGKGHEFWSPNVAGRIEPRSDEGYRFPMYRESRRRLGGRRIGHYEISSFASPNLSQPSQFDVLETGTDGSQSGSFGGALRRRTPGRQPSQFDDAI